MLFINKFYIKNIFDFCILKPRKVRIWHKIFFFFNNNPDSIF